MSAASPAAAGTEATYTNPNGAGRLKTKTPNLACALLFVAISAASAVKYVEGYEQMASKWGFEGGAFAEFEIAVRFDNVPDQTAKLVKIGDEMILGGCSVGRVVAKDQISRAGGTQELILHLACPNWLKCYLNPSPQTKVIFATQKYRLKGTISSAPRRPTGSGRAP